MRKLVTIDKWAVILWFILASASEYVFGYLHAPWWMCGVIGLGVGWLLSTLVNNLIDSATLDGQMEENDWQMQLWAKTLGHPEATNWETLKDVVDADQTHLPPMQA